MGERQMEIFVSRRYSHHNYKDMIHLFINECNVLYFKENWSHPQFRFYYSKINNLNEAVEHLRPAYNFLNRQLGWSKTDDQKEVRYDLSCSSRRQLHSSTLRPPRKSWAFRSTTDPCHVQRFPIRSEMSCTHERAGVGKEACVTTKDVALFLRLDVWCLWRIAPCYDCAIWTRHIMVRHPWPNINEHVG